MYRPERGSGLHCDNGRLQAGTCASVKEGDNGRDHHNCSSSIHNTFYSQDSFVHSYQGSYQVYYQGYYWEYPEPQAKYCIIQL